MRTVFSMGQNVSEEESNRPKILDRRKTSCMLSKSPFDRGTVDHGWCHSGSPTLCRADEISSRVFHGQDGPKIPQVR